ncbi:hypothetical protein X742_05855 [Mesorhizobium sp. LNHC232B00]|nr:hypothetical protein X742_05855 [Mesorhizobium sp. LNHC232B00]
MKLRAGAGPSPGPLRLEPTLRARTAIRPRAYAFSSIHQVAYRKTDAQRSLVQAFLGALFDTIPVARST